MGKIKTAMLVLVLTTVFGMLSAFNSNVSFEATVWRDGFGNKIIDYTDHFTTSYVRPTMVYSLDELKELCWKHNNTIFDVESRGILHEMQEQLIAYDEVYFSEKVLIVYSYYESPGIPYSVELIKKDNELLTVYFNGRPRGVVTNFQTIPWTIFIELKKVDIEGISEVIYHELT